MHLHTKKYHARMRSYHARMPHECQCHANANECQKLKAREKVNHNQGIYGKEFLLEYAGMFPVLGKDCFLAPGVKVIGQVQLGSHVNIWFNSIVRGDVAPITIGENTNIQDLSMLHVTEEHALTIGKNVSVGHHVVLHGASIGEGCLIGMGCIIMDGVVVGNDCLVAAGSLLPPGKVYPDGVLIKGSPAKVERLLTLEEKNRVSRHYLSYLTYTDQYKKQGY
jgi:carbonic anhydrase/acetyltransferase-like protein (isoleucine patch superfamily)